MYSYNRDVYEAEQERMVRMLTASQRQVPYHLRRSSYKQVSGWLSEHVGSPTSAVLSSSYAVVSHRVIILYRRASTRVAGLVLNALEGLFDLAPGRT
ncbi:MAG: hypothetical protein PVH65_18220 [Chloroflexota bacterium]|jgi:hypothetical protein